jgi:hypothetical protein
MRVIRNNPRLRLLALAAFAISALSLGVVLWAQDRTRDNSGSRRDRGQRDRGQQYAESGSAQGSYQRTPATAPSLPALDVDLNERYSLLPQRNIFLKNRTRPAPGSRDARGGRDDILRTQPAPEQSFLLTGIAMEEGRHVAFIENMNARATERVALGGSVARGKIVTIEIDYIEYESAGKRTRVEIGKNLVGGIPVFWLPNSGSSTTASTNGSPSTAPTTPADPNDPVERMRLRRLTEGQPGGAVPAGTNPPTPTPPASKDPGGSGAAGAGTSGPPEPLDPVERLKLRRLQENGGAAPAPAPSEGQNQSQGQNQDQDQDQ